MQCKTSSGISQSPLLSFAERILLCCELFSRWYQANHRSMKIIDKLLKLKLQPNRKTESYLQFTTADVLDLRTYFFCKVFRSCFRDDGIR